MDNTPPSLPLGLPPPLDISGEVAVDVSSEYEEVNTHTPQAWASFLKDKSVSLLCGATAQTFLGPVNTGTAQEEDLDDVPPPLVISGEVAVDVSSEYEEVNTHTPQAWASFLKDKSVSLLCGAMVQTFLGPGNTIQQKGFVSDDLLPSSKSFKVCYICC